MHIKIHYRHITHSEDLSKNIIGWFEQQLHIGSARNGLQIDLFFSKATPHTKSNSILFECHLRARAPWLSKEIFIKHQDEDFWKLVTECGHLLDKNINRDTEVKRDKKKQNMRAQLRMTSTA